jgi:hypothetical protein
VDFCLPLLVTHGSFSGWFTEYGIPKTSRLTSQSRRFHVAFLVRHLGALLGNYLISMVLQIIVDIMLA